jgi:hypothetical protein
MANENNNKATNTTNTNTAAAAPAEGPKKLTDAARLKLTHEIAMGLSELTQDDRRLVLTAVAASLGVASSAQRQQAAQRPAQQGRGR